MPLNSLPARVFVLVSRLFRGIPNLIRGFSAGWLEVEQPAVLGHWIFLVGYWIFGTLPASPSSIYYKAHPIPHPIPHPVDEE